MWAVLVFVVVGSTVAALAFRVWLSLPRKAERAAITRDSVKCLVVLGSGGHTSEMFYDLRSLCGVCKRIQFTYLIADTDRGSLAQAEAFEFAARGSAPEVLRVPRAREVGQSYRSSVLTTLRAAVASLRHVLTVLPDLVLANGPGTCVPVVAAAYVARILGIKRIAILYSESFACVEHLSLSGKILYHFADVFTVQWPQLLELCPLARYAGRLHGHPDELAGQVLPVPRPLAPLHLDGAQSGQGTAIVTVGSTKFDTLIQAVDSPAFLAVLRSHGIVKLTVQRGNGRYQPVVLGHGHTVVEGMEIEVLEYTPSLPAQLRQAGLVISHAGAGTILDCLLAGRRLVVVPNEGLMANHQVQLGMALQERHVLVCLRAGELVEGLRKVDFSELRRFPEQSSPVFGRCVAELLGLPTEGPAVASVRS